MCRADNLPHAWPQHRTRDGHYENVVVRSRTCGSIRTTPDSGESQPNRNASAIV